MSEPFVLRRSPRRPPSLETPAPTRSKRAPRKPAAKSTVKSETKPSEPVRKYKGPTPKKRMGTKPPEAKESRKVKRKPPRPKTAFPGQGTPLNGIGANPTPSISLNDEPKSISLNDEPKPDPMDTGLNLNEPMLYDPMINDPILNKPMNNLRARMERYKANNEQMKGMNLIKRNVNIGKRFGTMKSEKQRKKKDAFQVEPFEKLKLTLIEQRKQNAERKRNASKSKAKGTPMNLNQEAYMKLIQNQNKDAPKALGRMAVKETPKEKKQRKREEAKLKKKSNTVSGKVYEEMLKNQQGNRSVMKELTRMKLRSGKTLNPIPVAPNTASEP